MRFVAILLGIIFWPIVLFWRWARGRALSFEDRDVASADAPGQRIELDGVTMHYVDRGSGDAIVLIHGLGGSTYHWRKNIEPLAKRHRVVAVDLLGFGYSQRLGDTDYGLRAHAGRVAAFMTHLGIGRAVVGGHSMGGMVAMHLAETHPERVAGLVLIDSATPREMSAFASGRYTRWLHPFTYAVAMRNRWLQRRAVKYIYANPAPAADSILKHFKEMARFRGHEEALARLARGIGREPALRLEAVTAPVVIMWGSDDRLIRPSRGRWLRDRLGARLVVVPNAGHMLPAERPDAVNHELLAMARSAEQTRVSA